MFVVTIRPGQTVVTSSHATACAVIARWARQGVHASYRTVS